VTTHEPTDYRIYRERRFCWIIRTEDGRWYSPPAPFRWYQRMIAARMPSLGRETGRE